MKPREADSPPRNGSPWCIAPVNGTQYSRNHRPRRRRTGRHHPHWRRSDGAFCGIGFLAGRPGPRIPALAPSRDPSDLRITRRKGRPCQILESRTDTPSPEGYSRVVSWIDRETGQPIIAEAYGADGNPSKSSRWAVSPRSTACGNSRTSKCGTSVPTPAPCSSSATASASDLPVAPRLARRFNLGEHSLLWPSQLKTSKASRSRRPPR
jgi:hypothetical protein